MGFVATACVACASFGLVAVPINATARESLSMSRRFIVLAELAKSRLGNGAQVVVAGAVLFFAGIVLIRFFPFFTSASISRTRLLPGYPGSGSVSGKRYWCTKS